ncbi:DNA segregation ATPase FtsK/SpoIIIE, S-DNA-T family [Streptoalloteichus tenebrarius]|uniref:DNA segregation ATPase FtsK/SpoIIIE, S-DNA-T family n=1 Tax=Streptoalloteichus tenebrarius (strain ATCC 17920 / DSM 40477 / JCM 4838 / CBS 697.72 / NBRC 16177 / NCIMB 11028 / NRRL B-12390 / A12253. 1 / ISP 5477) TaxID=1933 RepID=A0ABT1I380_STRSD|nr:FtsK/SpoIIIE domain-containing protein [Streptoalloteichus tenebrarius]MCP2262248.1 DNA segregation ATPase FtsK/SpoIIIE, S-DNA-T family [Streptoalloteichus tenebrarius]BFF00772.1 hypothetical protein GCM10020241_24470 [Streptoalloteichus tenebrarius]
MRTRPTRPRQFGRRHQPVIALTVKRDRRRPRRRDRSDVEPLHVLAWRYRYYLAPIYLTFLVWGGGALAHRWLGTGMTLLVVLVAVAAAAFWTRRAHDRRVERAYTVVVAATVGAWLVAAACLGAGHPVLLRVLAVAALLCAVPWWAHHRIRSQVRVERTVAAWPSIAEATGLKGSKLVGVVVNTWGWTGRLTLAAGQTARDVMTKLRTVESVLKLPVGSLRAEPCPDRADVALVRVVHADPHRKTILWTGKPARSIAVPLEVGPYDDGDTCRVPLFDQVTGTHHALLAGTNGSGKSGLLNLVACHVVTAPDALLWAIDLKGGMELRPWWPVCDWLATTTSEAADMLAALRAVVDARGQVARHRVWQSSPAAPVISVLIDEAAELPADVVADLESVARRGRALGVQLVLATQYPTANAVGSTQVRAQLRTRAAFRFMKTSEAATVVTDTAATDPATIRKDRPGCCFVEAAGAERPALVRCYWVDDAAVAQVVETWRGRQPALDPVSARAAGTAYARRRINPEERPDLEKPRRGEEVEQGTSVVVAEPSEPARTPTASPPQQSRLTNEEAHAALRTALLAAGNDGTNVEALCEACGRRKTWVYRELDALEEQKMITRARRHGYYRATRRLRQEHDGR